MTRDGTTWRGGMIGAGAWSRRQLTGWSRVTNARIVALCDRHPDRRDPIVHQFGIRQPFDDVESMLDRAELDFVDICVRPYSHAALVRLAATRGLPVLCQKPFCQSLDEARQVVELCRDRGVRLMVNENFRWEPWYQKVKELLDGRAVGEPFLARHSRRCRVTLPGFKCGQAYFSEMPRLLGYEMGPHYFDTFRYLFGEPKSLYARTHRVSPQVKGDDVLVVLLNYEGMTGVIGTSWASVPIPGLDRAPGQRGGYGPELLEVDGTEGTLVVGADASLELHTDSDHRRWSFDGEAMDANITAALRHFVDCLESGAEFATSGEEALRTMALVYATYLSAEEGRAVDPREILAAHQVAPDARPVSSA